MSLNTAFTSPTILRLSIIIISFNTREMTLKCLETAEVELQASRTTANAKIVVVDNGSKDGSVEAIRARFPAVLVIENVKNRGFGAANNQAILAAPAEFYLLLNSDAFLHAGTIDNLFDAMVRHPRAAVAGPRLLNEDGTLQLSCYRFPTPGHTAAERLFLTALMPGHPVLGDYRNWAHDSERTVDFVIGACCLVRTEACEQVGFFDEDFFLYAEETDWCFRFTRAGWEILFTPEATVTHVGGGSGGEQSAKVFCEFQRAQERFVIKHFGQRGVWVHRTTTAVGALVRMALFGATSVVKPAHRAQLRLWRRIFIWTIGRRGPGLEDVTPRQPAGSANLDSSRG